MARRAAVLPATGNLGAGRERVPRRRWTALHHPLALSRSRCRRLPRGGRARRVPDQSRLQRRLADGCRCVPGRPVARAAAQRGSRVPGLGVAPPDVSESFRRARRWTRTRSAPSSRHEPARPARFVARLHPGRLYAGAVGRLFAREPGVPRRRAAGAVDEGAGQTQELPLQPATSRIVSRAALCCGHPSRSLQYPNIRTPCGGVAAARPVFGPFRLGRFSVYLYSSCISKSAPRRLNDIETRIIPHRRRQDVSHLCHPPI